MSNFGEVVPPTTLHGGQYTIIRREKKRPRLTGPAMSMKEFEQNRLDLHKSAPPKLKPEYWLQLDKNQTVRSLLNPRPLNTQKQFDQLIECISDYYQSLIKENSADVSSEVLEDDNCLIALFQFACAIFSFVDICHTIAMYKQILGRIEDVARDPTLGMDYRLISQVESYARSMEGSFVSTGTGQQLVEECVTHVLKLDPEARSRIANREKAAWRSYASLKKDDTLDDFQNLLLTEDTNGILSSNNKFKSILLILESMLRFIDNSPCHIGFESFPKFVDTNTTAAEDGNNAKTSDYFLLLLQIVASVRQLKKGARQRIIELSRSIDFHLEVYQGEIVLHKMTIFVEKLDQLVTDLASDLTHCRDYLNRLDPGIAVAFKLLIEKLDLRAALALSFWWPEANS